MDPLSAGVFASIGSAFKFADVAVRIAEVGSENAVFVRAICVVRSDLEEVERLLSLESIQIKLTSTSGKLPWIKTAIQNTRCSLNEIGKWVERARVEQETTGSIKFDTRVRWVFNDHEKLLNRKTELSTCHQQLSNVLGYLIGLEEMPAKPVSLDSDDASYFDDILSGHRRSSRPQTSDSKKGKPGEVHTEPDLGAHAAKQMPSPSTYPPPDLDVLSSPKTVEISLREQHNSGRSPSITSSMSPPGSPPPTYATAMSLDPLILHDVHGSSSTQATINREVAAARTLQSKVAMDNTCNNTWAYRTNSDDMGIPELAGDAISFSATNSAGPVNPFELCTSTERIVSSRAHTAQSSSGNLAEMLGDVHFPVEIHKNHPGSPPGYPSWLGAMSDQVGLARPTNTQPRRRTASETSRGVYRRPLPINALSDSLLTVHELPSALGTPDTTLQSQNRPSHTTYGSSFAVELPSNPPSNQRPTSYDANQSRWSTDSPATNSNRHYSATPPVATIRNEWATAFSADSTSSWGLDTEPKKPKEHTAQVPKQFTRMQSQKRLMDLLGSIDT